MFSVDRDASDSRYPSRRRLADDEDGEGGDDDEEEAEEEDEEGDKPAPAKRSRKD